MRRVRRAFQAEDAIGRQYCNATLAQDPSKRLQVLQVPGAVLAPRSIGRKVLSTFVAEHRSAGKSIASVDVVRVLQMCLQVLEPVYLGIATLPPTDTHFMGP